MGTERLFHAPQRKCITGITVQTSRVSTGVFDLVRCIVCQREAAGWKTVEMSSRKAEMNKQELSWERVGSKIPVVDKERGQGRPFVISL